MKKILVVFLFIIIFCSNNNTKDSPVAKVGNQVLTLEMINDILEQVNKHSIEFDEKKNYVDRWVERQLLYEEAERRGLRDDPFIKREISKLQMELSIDKLLDLEIGGDYPTKEALGNFMINNNYDNRIELQRQYHDLFKQKNSEQNAIEINYDRLNQIILSRLMAERNHL